MTTAIRIRACHAGIFGIAKIGTSHLRRIVLPPLGNVPAAIVPLKGVNWGKWCIWGKCHFTQIPQMYQINHFTHLAEYFLDWTRNTIRYRHERRNAIHFLDNRPASLAAAARWRKD